jgi:chlorite dismutase
MRHLRGARARLFTKLETPFFTGGMKSPADLVAVLP